MPQIFPQTGSFGVWRWYTGFISDPKCGSLIGECRKTVFTVTFDIGANTQDRLSSIIDVSRFELVHESQRFISKIQKAISTGCADHFTPARCMVSDSAGRVVFCFTAVEKNDTAEEACSMDVVKRGKINRSGSGAKNRSCCALDLYFYFSK